MDGTGMIDTQEKLNALARRIVVAIPTLNEAAVIKACIRSLLEGNEALGAIDCIVADGGSSDGTPAIVRQLMAEFPNLSIMENPGRLQSAAVNAVARTAAPGRDILVRCDAHSVYPRDFILLVAEAMERVGSDSLVVPMDAVGEGCFQRANAWIVDTKLGSGGSAHRGGRLSGFVDHGHHAAFRRDRFLALGGYDETFSHNEDAEYDARLRRDGGRIWLDAGIRIKYFPRANPAGLWRQYFNYGKGRARNVLKNREIPRFRQMIPVLNIFALAGSLLIVLPFHWLGLVWPVLYLAVLGGTSFWLVEKRRSTCGLLGGVALGVMHLAWGLGFIVQSARSAMRGEA